jgi:hypothetical protein
LLLRGDAPYLLFQPGNVLRCDRFHTRSKSISKYRCTTWLRIAATSRQGISGCPQVGADASGGLPHDLEERHYGKLRLVAGSEVLFTAGDDPLQPLARVQQILEPIGVRSHRGCASARTCDLIRSRRPLGSRPA